MKIRNLFLLLITVISTENLTAQKNWIPKVTCPTKDAKFIYLPEQIEDRLGLDHPPLHKYPKLIIASKENHISESKVCAVNDPILSSDKENVVPELVLTQAFGFELPNLFDVSIEVTKQLTSFNNYVVTDINNIQSSADIKPASIEMSLSIYDLVVNEEAIRIIQERINKTDDPDDKEIFCHPFDYWLMSVNILEINRYVYKEYNDLFRLEITADVIIKDIRDKTIARKTIKVLSRITNVIWEDRQSNRNAEKEYRVGGVSESLYERMLHSFFSTDGMETEIINHSKLSKQTYTSSPISIVSPSKKDYKIGDSKKACISVIGNENRNTGFYISSDGYAITKYSALADTTQLTTIMNYKGDTVHFQLVRSDFEYDLALIKTNEVNTSYLPLATEESKIGQDVYSLSAPITDEFSVSISSGIIGQKRNLCDRKYLQTDIPYHYVAHGGPVFHSDGRVIGMLTGKYIGVEVECIGLVVPSKEILDKLGIAQK